MNLIDKRISLLSVLNTDKTKYITKIYNMDARCKLVSTTFRSRGEESNSVQNDRGH